MKIFYELADKEIFIDIMLSDEDLVLLQEGCLISRNTIVPYNEGELFDRKVCVGVVAPQAKQIYYDVWDAELDENSDEERE